MAKPLFITAADLKQFTVVDLSLDNDKFLQFIDIAQEIHIQNILGTDLYEKIESDITGDTLSGDYETLVETYIKPALIYWAFYEFLPYAGVTIGNKGVFRHTSESAVTVEGSEIKELRASAKDTAEYYMLRLQDYLDLKDFTEYTTNTEGDVSPYRPKTGNWYL